LKFEERPPTPEKIRRFRVDNTPGSHVRHWGLAQDSGPGEDFIFGVKMDRAPVDVLNKEHLSRVQGFVRERSEAIYDSNKREPLGKPASHGHKLPDKVMSPDFKHGVTTKSGEAAFALLFPAAGSGLDGADTKENKERYKKSHGDYDPGEQVSRNYSVRGVDDLRNVSFGTQKASKEGGLGGTSIVDGVRKAINPDTANPSGVAPTQVFPKVVADFQQRNSDFLGKARQLTKGFEHSDEGLTFGRPSWSEKEGSVRDTARACILGYYDPADQLPDADLEKPVLRGAAPLAVLEDSTRKYGAPSCRTDKPPPKLRSVADMCNYGDDVSPSIYGYVHIHVLPLVRLPPQPSSFALMYPKPVLASDTQLSSSRSVEELRHVFVETGITSEAKLAEAIKSCSVCGDISISRIRAALKQLK
jgi:hypothetical protein